MANEMRNRTFSQIQISELTQDNTKLTANHEVVLSPRQEENPALKGRDEFVPAEKLIP
jgi:hypothetical protein